MLSLKSYVYVFFDLKIKIYPSCIPNAIALKSLQIQKHVKFYNGDPTLFTKITLNGSNVLCILYTHILIICCIGIPKFDVTTFLIIFYINTKCNKFTL